jgi:hypothetical protein
MTAIAAFCSNCGKDLRGGSEFSIANVRKRGVGLLLVIGFALVLLYFFISRNTSRSNSYSSTSSEQNVASIINSVTHPNTALTNSKMEDAVARLTSNLRAGGNIAVDGIQETTTGECRRAELRFVNFQYKSDMAGTPLSSDKTTPKKPDVNSPSF